MKKPRLPDNPNYWFNVIKNPKLVKDFQERGNSKQKRNLKRALEFDKWEKIQKRKEEI